MFENSFRFRQLESQKKELDVKSFIMFDFSKRNSAKSDLREKILLEKYRR